MNDECLRDAAKDDAQYTMIVRELEPQDCLEQQLNVLVSKMHRVRRRNAEPQAQEEKSPTDKSHFGVVKSNGSFQKLRILSKEKQPRDVADVNSSNDAQCKNEQTQSKSIAHTNARRVAKSTKLWRALCLGREDSDDEYDDLVGEQGRTA